MNYDVEVQPQQSGGEFQRYIKKRAKKNFDIPQVYRKTCCIFVETTYSQPQYLSSVQNSTI